MATAKKPAKQEAPVFQQVFKAVDDLLRKDAGCTSELDYTEQSSWLLFLKYLDALEQDREQQAKLTGANLRGAIESGAKMPVGWQDVVVYE